MKIIYKTLLIGILCSLSLAQVKAQDIQIYNLTELRDLAQNSDSGENIVIIRTGSPHNTSSSNKIEKRTFNNVSKIKIAQRGGRVTINESSSNNVEVTIEYVSNSRTTPECEVFVKNKELNLKTTKSSTSGRGYFINYTIAMPKNIAADIAVEYGNLSIDKIQAHYMINLSYSSAAIGQVEERYIPDISLRYGSIKVEKAKDIKLSIDYSKVSIEKANDITLSGKYNSFIIDEANSIVFPQGSKYNKYQIGSINNINSRMKYDKIDIATLNSDLDIKSDYAKINVKSVSPKAKSIFIDGSYSTIKITLNPSISANVEARIKYGDLVISDRYNVKTISSDKDDFHIDKKIQLGKGKPSLQIKVSNTYENIKIQ